MSTEVLVPRRVSIAISMFAFFLIFSTVAGLVELISDGPDGELHYALFAASSSTIVFGLAMSWIGTRLPGKWWGEAVLVAVIFYPIWLIMNAIGGSLDVEAWWTGAVYAVLAGIVSGIIFEILNRAKD